MSWTFRYKLMYGEQSVPLHRTLGEAGISVGNIVNISVGGRYKDLYENETKEMWDSDKRYHIASRMLRETELQKRIEERGPLTHERLKQIADSCFAHV